MIKFPLNVQGKQVDTFESLSELARQEDPQALFWIGECLLNGEHTRKDAGKAIMCYKLSALQGNAFALSKLGNLYLKGIGVRRNKAYAPSFMKASYGAGKIAALTQYAILLIEEGSDKEDGLALLKYARELGDDDADYFIEEYYPEALRCEACMEITEEQKIIWLKTGVFDLIDVVVDEFESMYLFVGAPNEGTELHSFYRSFSEISIRIYGIKPELLYVDDDQKILTNITQESLASKKKSEELGYYAGVSLGVQSDAGILYGMDRFGTPRGHGFAAERANHLNDLLKGKKVQILGDNNAKWGADRLVDGVQIQSKYCKTGAKCIAKCFDSNGYKYWNPDGTPMVVEVPSDKYSDALSAMKRRIINGEVHGVDDPNQAEKYVRKGSTTYEQTINIAKSGTIDSLVYDAKNGMVIGVGTFGISTTIAFATSIWNGENVDDALKIAVASGLKAGGTAFVSTIITSQVKRMINQTTLDAALNYTTDALSGWLGPRVSSLYLNAMQGGINIYGTDAMKQVSKVFKDEIISGTVTMVIMSAGDISDIFRGRISGGQFVKNVSGNAATVAGASVGRTIGGTIGSFIPVIGPLFGRTIGTLVGGAVGGMIANEVVTGVLDEFVDDDRKKMLQILENGMRKCARDYLINKEEAEWIVSEMQQYIDEEFIKDMYQGGNWNEFAYEFTKQFCEHAVKYRTKIIVPKQSEIAWATKEVLEVITKEYEEKFKAIAS